MEASEIVSKHRVKEQRSLIRSARFLKSDPEAPEPGHDVPVTDFARFVLVNHREQIDGISGKTADLPVMVDSGAWPRLQVTQGLAGASLLFCAVIAHLLPPLLSVAGDCRDPLLGSLMFEKLWK